MNTFHINPSVCAEKLFRACFSYYFPLIKFTNIMYVILQMGGMQNIVLNNNVVHSLQENVKLQITRLLISLGFILW